MENSTKCDSANLSEDYFTNRQDRYHVLESLEVAAYFRKVHSALCSVSFRISPSTDGAGYSMDWPESNPSPSPLDDAQGYRQQSTKVLAPLLKPAGTQSRTTANHSTVVYPILQFTPILRPDTSTELPALLAILKSLQSPPLAGSSWTFTAGYFNMTPTVRRLLLSTQPSKGTVIAASPWSNSFLGAPGVRGMLPDAYTHLSKRFVDTVRRKGLSDRITLKEWRRGTKGLPDGWTYHAKGIWVSVPGETKPSLTVVGSSNYTRRSYELDLEANVVIVTRDESLMRRLGQEERWLQEYAREVGSEEYEKPERRVGWRVRLAMLAVRILGGAL
jgi:CDP-diacylglycerol---glycerol-3-phosphate 3-phosphatidyltransferase